MSAQVFHRETCRLCDSGNVELVVKLEPIPLSENYTDDAESGKRAARYPVDLYMCTDCGHVQQLDVVDYRDMVVVVRDVIANLIKQGKTLDQIKAASPAKPYETQYGTQEGSTSAFVEAIYKSLTVKK